MSAWKDCREVCMHRLSIHGDLEAIVKEWIIESIRGYKNCNIKSEGSMRILYGFDL